MPQAVAAQIAQGLQSTAEAQTYATACSAGAVAIGEASRRIRDGYLDVAIAGGAESMFSPVLMAAWVQLHVLFAEPGTGPTGYFRPSDHRPTGIPPAPRAPLHGPKQP